MEVYDHRKLNDAIDLAAYILSLSEQIICDGFDERKVSKSKIAWKEYLLHEAAK